MAKKRGSKKSSGGAGTSLRLRDGLEFMAGDTLVELRVDQQLATVFLDSYESSCINLQDPTDLEFEYMQQMTAALSAFIPEGAVEALHLGGCACALPLAWDRERPGSAQTVVELNGALAESMRELFDLPRAPRLKIRVDEAWRAVQSMRPERFDVLVRDVFAGPRTPMPLRSIEFFRRAKQVLRPGGLLLVNCVHGAGIDARADCAGALEAFEHVAIVSEGKILNGGRRGNVVIVAYKPADEDEPVAQYFEELQRLLRKLPISSRYLNRQQATKWVGTVIPIKEAEFSRRSPTEVERDGAALDG
ncbi:MAG: fused MFS/spermidine synthase [Actinomycetaceae bacterium]|nr:fused MFS/spermidine synthase [Actinomycetaceae bacterium]